MDSQRHPGRRYALLLLLAQWMGLLSAGAASYSEIETAVRNDDLARVQSMINADGGVKSDTASLCLMVASLWNKQQMAEKLLTQGISPNASPLYTHEAGETPLTYAIFAADEKMVAFLLASGADPNYRGDCRIKDCRGRMPLDLAVKWGLLEIAARLLDGGADPNAGQCFAAETANQQGDVKMYQLLLAHNGHLADAAAKSNGAEAQPKIKPSADTNSLRSLGLAELLPQAGAPSPPAQGKGTCRLAIISDDANAAAADVLVARLTGQPSLQLVERQELDRVFAEKQLTRQFAAQEANYNRVAALLRADALLLIRARDVGRTAATEARFIRVHPGIVLDTVYRAAPLADIKKWAEEMSARVASLAGKAIREDAAAISILDVHAAVPTPVTAALEKTLTVLLRDRLVHHPRFIVLERAEMEKLAFENAGEKPFWTGTYLADPLVDVALDNSGNFTLTLRLQPAAKGMEKSAKVSGKRSEPARAIDDALKVIDQQLGGPVPPPRREIEWEANSYLEEARWALAAKMPARAAAAVEVTWALGLQNLAIARLRVQSAEQAVQNSVSRRYGPEKGSVAETLDFAIQAVGVWDDVLQGNMLRDRPAEFHPWVESASALTDVATLAVFSVGPATEQIQQSERLANLRKMYWAALNDVLIRSRSVASNSLLPELISKTQLGAARIMLPDGKELRAALQEILTRHFATNDAVAHAELLLGLRWQPSTKRRIETYSGPREIVYRYPDNMPVREWLLDSLRRTHGPEGRFVALALDFEGPVIQSAEHSTRLMEEFWAMRDGLALDGELFKRHFERLHKLIENEPMSNSGYVPRNYQLNLEQDESAEKASHEMTQFEFNRRLYIYLINHATRPQPAFDELVSRYASRYSPEQKNELQQVSNRYAARTGASPVSFAPARATTARRIEPNAAPDKLPPLQVRRFWHPFNLDRTISPDFEFHSASMLWAEGRLWFEGSVHDFESKPQQMHHYIFALEPLTMKTEVIELPAIPLTPVVAGPAVEHGVRFSVRPDYLVVSAAHDFFALYDRSARTWQTFPALQPARVGRPEIIGDVAYLVIEDGNAVISFDLKKREAKVLASTRRRPAESPLDDPALWFNQIFKSQAGDLIVLAQSDRADYLKVKSVAQSWSPTTQSWKLIEGPARSLSDRVWGPKRGAISAAPILAQCSLNTVGDAIVEGGARATAFTLRMRSQPKPFDSIPLMVVPDALRLPYNRYGPQNLTIKSCFECPAGYIFPPWPGAGFWFISKKEFEDYIHQTSRALETAGP